jgi:hypothetical protein
MRPYLEKPITKRAGGVAQGIGPHPSIAKNKNLYI